jgi:plastocyanin
MAIHLVLILITIVIFSTTSIVYGASISIGTDKTAYDHNSIIYVNGVVLNPMPNVDILLEVINPTKDIIETVQLDVDSNGKFHTSLKTSGQDWLLDGEYTIKVIYSTPSKFDEVKVELVGGVGAPITVSTRSAYYEEGDTIRISGGVGQLLSNAQITLMIFDPLGNEVLNKKISVGPYKKFVLELTAGDENWIYDGLYTLRAIYSTKDRLAETTFEYKGIEGISAPELPTISVLTDKPEYDIGDVIIISGNVKDPDVYAGIPVTIRIIDPEGNSASVFSAIPTVANTFSTQISTIMPPWESSGVYEVIVNFRDQTASTTFLFSSGDTTSTPQLEPPKGGEVVIPYGTSVTGCQDTNECYIPNKLQVRTGEFVSWFNNDIGIHTVTSGVAPDGSDGNFNSDDLNPGFKFSHTFLEPGTYPYYCLYHPWQTGEIVVEGISVVEEDTTDSFEIPETSSEIKIPSWIKDVAKFWCSDKINDKNFLSAIQYLIENDVIIVPETSLVEGYAQKIPSWIKSNACWWSQDQISDQSFASGLEFLIENGVIRV